MQLQYTVRHADDQSTSAAKVIEMFAGKHREGIVTTIDALMVSPKHEVGGHEAFK